jgi:hypothetical protein
VTRSGNFCDLLPLLRYFPDSSIFEKIREGNQSATLAYLRVPLRDAFLSFWLEPCCSVPT